jgi:dTDP-4-amino-4,6-dideoxygalactose transaminase
MREHFGVRHVFLVSSGKAALTLILRALTRLATGREVVVPAYTCFSVPAAVVRAGLTVRPADVNPVDFDFDRGSLAGALSDRTLAVVSTHLFGIPSDVGATRRLCDRQGIFVIEDAAQAMGGRRAGRLLGTLGHVGFFSLDRGKNVTAGAGGVILTDCDRIGEALTREYEPLPRPGTPASLAVLFRVIATSVFTRPALFWLPAAIPWLRLGETRFDPGFPVAQLSPAAAGVALRWQARLASSNGARTRAGADLAARLGLDGVQASRIPFLRLPVLMPTREARDGAFAAAARRGLGVGRMYPAPVSEIGALRASVGGRAFPSATRVAERLLTLPTHELVAARDRAAICEVLLGAAAPRPAGSATDLRLLRSHHS